MLHLQLGKNMEDVVIPTIIKSKVKLNGKIKITIVKHQMDISFVDDSGCEHFSFTPVNTKKDTQFILPIECYKELSA